MIQSFLFLCRCGICLACSFPIILTCAEFSQTMGSKVILSERTFLSVVMLRCVLCTATKPICKLPSKLWCALYTIRSRPIEDSTDICSIMLVQPCSQVDSSSPSVMWEDKSKSQLYGLLFSTLFFPSRIILGEGRGRLYCIMALI